MSRLRTTLRRTSPWLVGFFLLALLAGAITRAELTEDEKKQLFLKARERMRTISTPTPEPSATPHHKPKPAKHPPEKKKKSAPKKIVEPEEKPEGTPKPAASETPAHQPAPSASAANRIPPNESSPSGSAPPISGASVTTIPSQPSQVVVSKSGYQKPRGFSLLPFHLFGKRYQYMTRSVRAEIDRAPVLRERWQFIIVHNSGTRQGNARIFDYYHRNVRRMRNGLAYHFVIGNGSSSGNGEIEVGDRWRRQINGGHVHSDYLNNISLGICLVGDFNRDQPTRAQLDSAEELIRYLRERCGKTNGHEIPVRPHKEMNPPRWPTDCPGDAFPYRWFGQFR